MKIMQLGTESAIFWKRAHLAFSSAKKWHFGRPNLRTDYKNLAKHPSKWWGRLLVHAFQLSGEYQANYEKSHIFYRFGPLLPNKRGQNFKPVSIHENVDRDFSIFFVPFLYIKRHQKITPAKVLEKIALWQHALMRVFQSINTLQK